MRAARRLEGIGMSENSLKALADTLRKQPATFGFFQAVRHLERLHEERTSVGGFDDPTREVVRFGVNHDIAFPPSEIHSLSMDSDQPQMYVNFMGLTGPQGVLPHQYSILIAERLRARDTALRDFLDLFHHRIISLFYQAWRVHRPTIARETGDKDRLAAHLADLIGLGLESCRNRFPFPDEALIYRAGLLAVQPRGAAALKQLLEDFFDVGAEVDQFVGAWYPLQQDDLCSVGEEEGAGNTLGFGAVAGDEAWDLQSRVRVRLGPLGRARYESFLPGGASHEALHALLRFYSHDQFDFEVQLVLASEDVKGLQLGADTGQRLGWSTWICSTARDRDADETILSLQNRAA